jgi:hypothetical protein
VGRSADLGGTPFDETQPWEIRVTKTPGNFNTLLVSDVAEFYMIVEYTLA